MSLFLASVTNLDEAQLALLLGADIIDLKNPAAGALGALSISTIEEIVRFVAGQRPVSATVGDLPMQPEILLTAVQEVAATGVDFVKVGFAAPQASCLQALQPLSKQGVKLIAVLFADQNPNAQLADFAQAGFYGVMLDTANKTGKRLTDYLTSTQLAEFVAQAHGLGLFVGLAGSLNSDDIAPLSALQADYLGFRGALCLEQQRSAAIAPKYVDEVRRLLHKYHAISLAVATKALQSA